LSERGKKRTRAKEPTEAELAAASVEVIPARVPPDPSARNDRSAQNDRSA
jgi:hypothetical protein